MKTNLKTRAKKLPAANNNAALRTYEGSPSATHLQTPLHQLRRLVMANMLFEGQFYVDGKTTADAVRVLANKVDFDQLALLAVEARSRFNLRHVPLLLLSVLIDRARVSTDYNQRYCRGVARAAVASTIQRPDEMGELIALYRAAFKMTGKMKLPSLMKAALADAFNKFDTFQLAKYANRPAAISLRDVMFLVHPKPTGDKAALFTSIANKTLTSPPTWEVQLSAGGNKKEVFEQLLSEKKIGGLAFLRNLRNMSEAGVSRKVMLEAFSTASRSMSRVMPFRFLSAAKHAGDYRQQLHDLFLETMGNRKKLGGSTLIVVDVSGSMTYGAISNYSEMNRAGAAAALAAIGREVCSDVAFVVTGNRSLQVNSTLRGLDAAEKLYDSREATQAGHGGIYLHDCMNWCKQTFSDREFERVIVITDEQDCGGISKSPANAPTLGKYNYLINVGAYSAGIAHDKWLTISGFSDAVFDYMLAVEELV